MRPMLSLFVASSIACGGGGKGGDTDTDANTPGAENAGYYETTSWSDDPACSGAETPGAAAGMKIALNAGVWELTPCNAPGDCDIVRSLWSSDVQSDGNGEREITDAAYNQSNGGCQVFLGTIALTFDGAEATFDRSTITNAFAGTPDTCDQVLAEWDRTGTRADCFAWTGTRAD